MSESTGLGHYTAAGFQVAAESVPLKSNKAEGKAHILAGIKRLSDYLVGGKAYLGPGLKLVVWPEYVLTGFPQGRSLEEWREVACIHSEGPEMDALGEMAQTNNVFMAINVYEVDPAFPELFFQACLIFEPSGDVCLRYHRLNSLFSPTPHDVWQAYLDTYGSDAIFPVADTDIGKLAPIASEEVIFPEVARAFGLRGAQVFVHPTSEHGSPELTAKDIAKRARAAENLAYVVSANTGGIRGAGFPEGAADGRSKVVDYKGHVLKEAGWGETMSAHATIDLVAQARVRRTASTSNQLGRLKLETVRAAYGVDNRFPADGLGEGSSIPESRVDFSRRFSETLERLDDAGLL